MTTYARLSAVGPARPVPEMIATAMALGVSPARYVDAPFAQISRLFAAIAPCRAELLSAAPTVGALYHPDSLFICSTLPTVGGHFRKDCPVAACP